MFLVSAVVLFSTNTNYTVINVFTSQLTIWKGARTMARRHHLDSKRFSIGMGLAFLLFVTVDRPIARVHAQVSDIKQSVAIVSNMGGEANITSSTRGLGSEEATLQGPLVYGDRIETAQNSILSMLVGEGALVSMSELSEVTITQTPEFPKVVNLVRGSTCICPKGQMKNEEDAIPVQTPTVIVNPSPGAMFRVTVTDTVSQTSKDTPQPKVILTHNAEPHMLYSQSQSEGLKGERVETIEVMLGSVEIVSQIAGVSPITIDEQLQIEVKNGVLGQPTKASAVSCQIQDLQKNPQHTANPKEIRNLIAQQQSIQTTGIVAALITPNVETADTSTQPNEPNVILAVTNQTESDIDSNGTPPGAPAPDRTPVTITPPLTPGNAILVNNIVTRSTPNEDLIQITGPNPVEINSTALGLDNSAVDASGPNDNITLVSVSSSGTLRDTSPDPIISIQDSQTTTETAVNVIDQSVIQASAPLIAALTTNRPNTVASQLTTTSDTVQVAGSNLIGFLPADALALLQLDGSSLISAGSVFNVSGGGNLGVSGNLVSATNGSQLVANSLVSLSGGSRFGLTGGSLLFGDNSSTVTINNTLCAAGGCTNGFVFAPAGNTITIANNFQPTQGIDVPDSAALIVVNGTGNTVVLSP